MAGSKRERELARRRLERQAERRAARRHRQRQWVAVTGSVIGVLALIGGSLAVFGPGGGGADATKASSSPSPTVAGLCSYPKAGTPARGVGTPPATPTTRTGSSTATITTNRGDVVVSLLAEKAPCTVNSFSYLAAKGYYADTPCHRLTSGPSLFVLQCGDPTGTGSGGPGYQFGDENLSGATYPAGTVAMANSGPNTNGSQFFLVYRDSQLSPNYTPFGKVTAGLDVLEQVAKAGTADGAPDGKPKQPVTIKTITIPGR